MELSYFAEFLALAKQKNFHAAAEELGISQPTLTSHIKKLETELAASLFDRGTRHVELSDYGKLLFPYAESILSLYGDAMRAIGEKQSRDKLVLTVAVEPHYMVGEVLQLLNRYQKEHPNIIIEFANVPGKSIHEVLRSGRCDMAIIPQRSAGDGEFQTVTIREEHAVIFVGKGHPLAERGIVRIQELRSENLLIPPARLVLYQLLASACRAAGFELEAKSEGASEMMGILLVKEGYGVMVLPDYAAKKLADGDLRIVELRPRLKWYVNLLCPNVHSSPEGNDLLAYIRASLASAGKEAV
ncbi:MAG: LysR family transcriptional regulator [Oscillospiraceae bacterium]|nr:LysR family transcriptional regulator [Oscillospiraceae bacterium]